MIRWGMMLGAVWLGTALTVRAADWKYSTKAVKAELVQVIDEQLAAFRRDDYWAAYHLAARELRRQYSLPVFELMIRRGYPLIARNQGADYGLARDNGVEAEVLVIVRGADGQPGDFRYLLVYEDEAWRIGSVTEVPRAGPDA